MRNERKEGQAPISTLSLIGRVRKWVPVPLFLLGCGGGGEPAAVPTPTPTLETVEVGAAPDAAASLAEEQVERRRRDESGVAGVLPAGFPTDVPLFQPSSLVDFASQPGGGISITLDTRQSYAAVRAAYPQQLAAAGWQAAGEERYRKGERELSVTFADNRPGCRIRLTAEAR